MKGRHVRRIAHELVKRFPGKFGSDFAQNKKELRELKLFSSGEELNKLAGELAIEQRRSGTGKEAAATV